jgi:hypothetical protein
MSALRTDGRYPATIKVPFTGKGSVVNDGTLVMPGVTQATDMGLIIPVPAANAGLDNFGIYKGTSATANDSLQAGTTWTFAEIELTTPGLLCEMDYSAASADLLTLTSVVTSTSIAITSWQNNIDCSWIYVAAGTGIGQLLFLTACTSGSGTLMTAPNPSLDTTSKIIFINRIGLKVIGLNASSLIKSAAVAGVYTAIVLENYIDSPANGIPKQLLNPTIHNGLTLKIPSKVTFSSRVLMRQSAGQN